MDHPKVGSPNIFPIFLIYQDLHGTTLSSAAPGPIPRSFFRPQKQKACSKAGLFTSDFQKK
jgi:hypothetical protein